MGALPEWMLSLPKEGITAEHYDQMPVEDCRNIEIVDGRIVVCPSQTPHHNLIALRLTHDLDRQLPEPWQVTSHVDLRISEFPLTNRRPDILVFRGNPDELPIVPTNVLLAAEIMSQSSVSTDRLDKPAEYASAGIPYFWRFELEGDELIAYTYICDSTTKTYGEPDVHKLTLKTARPFPIEIDLAALL
ncbi:Uma2 family endonuclease [Actinomadura adrarensis]|uniref:Uma2 family endonuclease n=1 Tax=Actinomadura adrarensis TaxID=1819600 RepID=A0ABW3CPQ9_9ACTN